MPIYALVSKSLLLSRIFAMFINKCWLRLLIVVIYKYFNWIRITLCSCTKVIRKLICTKALFWTKSAYCTQIVRFLINAFRACMVPLLAWNTNWYYRKEMKWMPHQTYTEIKQICQSVLIPTSFGNLFAVWTKWHIMLLSALVTQHVERKTNYCR